MELPNYKLEQRPVLQGQEWLGGGGLPPAYCLALIFSQLSARSRKLPEYREFLLGSHGEAEPVAAFAPAVP